MVEDMEEETCWAVPRQGAVPHRIIRTQISDPIEVEAGTWAAPMVPGRLPKVPKDIKATHITMRPEALLLSIMLQPTDARTDAISVEISITGEENAHMRSSSSSSHHRAVQLE